MTKMQEKADDSGQLGITRDVKGLSQSQTVVPLQAAQRPFVATLDVGTSSVRALLFDGQGRQIADLVGQELHTPHTTHDGGSEFDPDALYRRCVRVLQSLMKECTIRPDAVAVSIFWHSLMAIDVTGTPITPLYLWADTRSHRHVESLRTRLDERAVHARTGCLFHTSYLPARLAWLAERDPALYRGAHRWLSFAEYMWLRLFGTAASSHSMASGSGLFLQNELTWDPELLAALDLEPRQLGELVDVKQGFREMSDKAAAELGPLAKVPWFPPLGDGACSNLGSGCVSPQRAAVMIGTSGAMRTIWAAPHLTPPWGLWSYRVDQARYVLGGALSNGGNFAAWLRDNLRIESLAAADAALRSVVPAAHGLTVLPFWAGERSPGWAAHATGAIVGLRLHTTALDLLQAGMEAVAYRFSLIFEHMSATVPEIETLMATGGGLLRSPAWMQIIADTLGRPLQACLELEASSRGAALIALEALGACDDLAKLPVAVGEVYEPDLSRHQMHMEARASQLALYDRLIRTAPIR